MPAKDQSITFGRLKKRAEFVRARDGHSWRTPSFVLLARRRIEDHTDDTNLARFGFTATKRLGKAVVRNRARRRLKETVRLLARTYARPGYDYVVIARHGALVRSFGEMKKHMTTAFEYVHTDDLGRTGKQGPRQRDQFNG